MQVNFFRAGEGSDACVNLSVSDDGFIRDIGSERTLVAGRALPRIAIPVRHLPIHGAEKADLNGDGVIDVRDIRAFARLHNLPLLPEFERTLTRLEGGKAGRAGR